LSYLPRIEVLPLGSSVLNWMLDVMMMVLQMWRLLYSLLDQMMVVIRVAGVSDRYIL
jgi:hypothetical protein